MLARSAHWDVVDSTSPTLVANVGWCSRVKLGVHSRKAASIPPSVSLPRTCSVGAGPLEGSGAVLPSPGWQSVPCSISFRQARMLRDCAAPAVRHRMHGLSRFCETTVCSAEQGVALKGSKLVSTISYSYCGNTHVNGPFGSLAAGGTVPLFLDSSSRIVCRRALRLLLLWLALLKAAIRPPMAANFVRHVLGVHLGSP